MFSSGQCHCAAPQGMGTGTGHTQRFLQEWCTLKFKPQGAKDTSCPAVTSQCTPGKSPSFCSSVAAFQTWGLSTAPSHCFDLLLCLPAALESPKMALEMLWVRIWSRLGVDPIPQGKWGSEGMGGTAKGGCISQTKGN